MSVTCTDARSTAQSDRIVERRPASVVPALAKLAETASDWRVRLHALWTLDGISAAFDGVEARRVHGLPPQDDMPA